MWWSRALAVIVAAGLLAACGFQPLYGGGKRGPAATELASIRIESIADRSGQILRNHLLDRLNPQGRPAHPAYVLRITLTDSSSGVAVRKSEFPTRTSLRVSASYHLARADTGQSVFSASSAIEGGYNILNSEFATLAAEQDVRERVLREVALDIEARLAAFFRLHQEQPAAQVTP
jgi:LPS-assembly lipoprotein